MLKKIQYDIFTDFVHSATAWKAGIQKETGFRIKCGMTLRGWIRTGINLEKSRVKGQRKTCCKTNKE